MSALLIQALRMIESGYAVGLNTAQLAQQLGVHSVIYRTFVSKQGGMVAYIGASRTRGAIAAESRTVNTGCTYYIASGFVP